VRATTGTAVQQTNCHPFRHRDWLFVHNGLIERFHEIRRELMMSIDPARFADVVGSTDSEVLFHLALTLGLERDPVFALQHAIGLVEETAERHGIANAVQASIGVTNGERVWAVRYSTEGRSRTLFTSADVHALHMLYPDNERLARVQPSDRVIVSEPFGDLPGAWDEVPESSVIVVGPNGQRDEHPFSPAPPPPIDASGLPPAPPLPV
jgi:glutamine amidotransferase